MTTDVAFSEQSFLSTQTAGSAARRLALGVLLTSAAFFTTTKRLHRRPNCAWVVDDIT